MLLPICLTSKIWCEKFVQKRRTIAVTFLKQATAKKTLALFFCANYKHSCNAWRVVAENIISSDRLKRTNTIWFSLSHTLKQTTPIYSCSSCNCAWKLQVLIKAKSYDGHGACFIHSARHAQSCEANCKVPSERCEANGAKHKEICIQARCDCNS